jgi:hypothetical protein
VAAGVYGWHFEQPPHPDLDAGRLLYVGIAPRYMANRTSTQNLRKRVRYHYRGNAAGSTLRLTSDVCSDLSCAGWAVASG